MNAACWQGLGRGQGGMGWVEYRGCELRQEALSIFTRYRGLPWRRKESSHTLPIISKSNKKGHLKRQLCFPQQGALVRFPCDSRLLVWRSWRRHTLVLINPPRNPNTLIPVPPDSKQAPSHQVGRVPAQLPEAHSFPPSTVNYTFHWERWGETNCGCGH